MPLSSYPNGFAQGVAIKNVPFTIVNPGKVWWVSNTTVAAKRRQRRFGQ
jgi:hypothetical protein